MKADHIQRKMRQALSKVWSSVNQIQRRRLQGARLPVPSIGVGNLQTGGAGKTPLVMEIAREALRRGLTVGILSRGYRSKWEKAGGVLSPSDIAKPDLCGDEPALIHERVPEAWLGIGQNRLEAFRAMSQRLASEAGKAFDLVILDDAFQHHAIRCDSYVLALTDAGVGDVIFRDDFSVVKPEHFLVLTKGASFPPELLNHGLKARLRYRISPPENPEEAFFLVTGLAHPERALASIEEAGYRVVDQAFFRDHHAFTPTEVRDLLRRADERGLTLLLTGKDAVKWKSLQRGGQSRDWRRIHVLEPTVEWLEGKSVWDSFLADLFQGKSL